MKLCSVEGCGRKHYSKGICNTHYRRLRTTGDIRPHQPVVSWRKYGSPECQVLGCDRLRVKRNRYCRGHQSRWQKWRDVMAEYPLGDPALRKLRKRPHPRCLAAGCMRVPEQRRYCAAHAARLQKYGDPLPELPLSGQPGKEQALMEIVAKARAYDHIMAMRG